MSTTTKVHHMAKYRTFRSAFELAVDLGTVAKALGIESARDAAVSLALRLDKLIVQGTPVDTGRARANWFVAEGAMRTDTTASTTGVARPALKGESVIFISNSLPYIVPLEYGHSGQAPNGMVRKAIAQVATEVTAGAAA